MKAQPDVVSAQRNGAIRVALEQKAYPDPSTQALLSHGLDIVLAAMRKHGGSAEVQRWCCEVLCNLAEQGGSDAAEAITARGGLKDAVCAMQTNQRNSEVQRWSAAVIGSIASSSSGSIVSRLMGSAAISALASALRTHPDSKPVQEHALAAMWSCADQGDQGLLECISASECLEVIVQSLRRFADEPEVRHWALAFLRAVAGQCHDVQIHAIISAGGLSAIAAAMKSARDSVEVQQRGLATLAMLSSHGGITPEERASALTAVTASMAEHLASIDVQLFGIAASTALVEGRKKIESLDQIIVATAVACMEEHKSDAKLQVSAHNLLWSMTDNEVEDVLQLVVEGGAPQAVIEAARQHPQNAELKQACDAWRRVLETFAREQAVAEATALAYPARESPALPPGNSEDEPSDGESDREDESSTTATDCEEAMEAVQKDGGPVASSAVATADFNDALEVEF